MGDEKCCSFVHTYRTPTRGYYWRCLTCGYDRDKPVCDVCINKCHKNHRVKSIGFLNLYCHCGDSPFCISKPSFIARDTCTYTYTAMSRHPQHLFKCLTCVMKGICVNCKEVCHDGHVISPYKFKKNAHCACGHTELEGGSAISDTSGDCDPQAEDSPSLGVNTFSGCSLVSLDHGPLTTGRQCTFGLFGEKYYPQKVFECFTCGFHTGNVVCQACAEVCHGSHLVKYKRESPAAYCDCGKRGQGSCRCLTPLDDEELLKIRTELLKKEYKTSRKRAPVDSEKDQEAPIHNPDVDESDAKDENESKDQSEGDESDKSEIHVTETNSVSLDVDLLKEPCVICLENPKNAVIFPCGHTCLCMDCSLTLKIKKEKCPLCRSQVGEIIKLRVS